MNQDHDTDIQVALMPAPMDGPSEGLVRRLRVLAHETPARAPWWRSPAAGPLLLTGTAAALIAVTTMMPTKASAKSFDLIVAAAQRINAFQFSIRSNEDGKKETFTIAGSDGHIAMQTGEGGLMQIDPGSLSIYSKEENKVTRMKFGGLVDAQSVAKEMQSGMAEGFKEMDLKKMLREYQEKYGPGGVYVSPVHQENGHGVYHVTLSSKTEPERVEMTVDAASDLPETLTVETKEGALVNMEMRFGDRVDPSLLRTSFPANAKVEEIDLGAMAGEAMKGLENIGKAFEEKGSKPQ